MGGSRTAGLRRLPDGPWNPCYTPTAGPLGKVPTAPLLSATVAERDKRKPQIGR